MAFENIHNIAFFGVARNPTYAKPEYYSEIKDGVLYRFDKNDWDYCQVISLDVVTPGFSYAHACGDSKLPQTLVVRPRPIPVRNAPLRPSDAIEAACYRRAQALTRSSRVYKFSYGQQRLFINGVPCQGPLTRSQARKKRVFSLEKIAERRAAAKEQLCLERFERLWGEGARTFLRTMGYKRQFIAPYVPFAALPTSVRQQKVTTPRSSINCSVLGTFIPITEAIRDSGLAFKLRQMIKGFRATFVKVQCKSVSLRDCVRAVYIVSCAPQMDQGSHGVPDDVTAERISNTVITTHNEESVGASPTTVLNWHNLTTTDPEQEYNFGTDRWNIYDVITWDKNQASGSGVEKISIPVDLMAKCWSQPSMALFKSNRYWRSDIELRFQLNTNKFQTGSLQCSYLYDCADDGGLTYRGNVYCLSQTNHCILDASGSNMGTLLIPYKFNNPYINTDNDKEYCRVFIKVLNALDCPSTVMGSASLTVYYRFINAKFMGTLDNALIVPPKPQMLTLMRALGAAAEAGLRSVNKDLNRDKPPEPSCPVPFTPRSTSSWCIGTNLVEPTNLLRLDSTGQTPHPNLILSSMKIKDIVNIFGIIVLDLKWSVDDVVGANLLRLDGAPIQKFGDGPSAPINWPIYPSADTAYPIPPISFISSLFSYWRGTMDLRIDIVGTPFHKGQLLISYIPRNHQLDEVSNRVTMEMAKSSNYTICDLSETRSFTINIPYISSRPMYPVKYSQGKGNNIPPPGYITIFVLNPLIPMDQVSRTVSINMYLKAGADFELLVPSQPSIGLIYDPVFKPEPNNVVKVKKPINPPNKAGLIPYIYGTTQGILYVSSNLNAYVGNLVTRNFIQDFIVQIIDKPFIKVENYTIRLISPIKSNLLYDRVAKTWLPTITFNYAAICEFSPDKYGLVPIEKDFIKWYGTEMKKPFTGLIFESEWVAYYTVDATDENRNKFCKDVYNLFDDYVLKVPKNTVSCPFWLHSDPQMDERQLSVNSVVPMSGSLVSTDSGLTILGESFNDLKTLCRRYQKLFNANIILDNTRTDKMSICFPVTPLGLINNSKNVDSTIPELFNRCRDGVIPLIASGFRYWRGSMRYRITTDSRLDINIIVQHRPDITSSMYEVTLITDNQDRNSYLNHGYSMVIQNLNVNNCVDIEVPWYSPYMLNSCHPGNDNDGKDLKYSLGSLYIGFNNSSSLKQVGISVYYSIGDDFRFDTFQGFPMVIDVNHAAIASPQMFSTIKSWVNLPKEIKKANETATDFQENVLPKIKNTITQELGNKFINVYEVLCDVACQLVHCVINPTTKTILWSVFSCFVKFGLLTMKCAMKLVALAQKIFSFAISVGTLPYKYARTIARFRTHKGSMFYRYVEIPLSFSFCERGDFCKVIDKCFERFDGSEFKGTENEYKNYVRDLEVYSYSTHARRAFRRVVTVSNVQEYFRFCEEFYKNLTKGVITEKTKLTDADIEKIAARYPEILNPFFGEEDEVEEIPRATPEMDGESQDDIAASMISVIYSSVCTLLSFNCKGDKSFKEYVPILLKGMGTTASGANNIFRFIKNNFKLFSVLYEKVMYNKYFCLRKYRILETENLDLNNWANSVSILLQPRFRTFVDNKQLWRDAVFGAARYGFMYLAEGTKNPQKKTNVDPFIRKLYDQIVRLRDELQQQKLFPSLRQEAFAIWIHGPPGVGKSTMIDDLTTNMLKAINFTHLNELKYTISPVTKHWDGCNQQPVVVIDDAFAVDEPEANAQQLWAYFQICSPIPLRPPMARIEDKAMTYNPEIFVTCANNSFPAITMLREKDALWRRRHLLIKTQLKSNCTTKDYPFGLTPDQVRNFEHMEFSIAKDPRSEKNPGYMAWVSYQDLLQICINNFKNFKVKSKATYEARHELHYSLYPQELHIPEEETLRNLYHKDNQTRQALLGEVVDTFGITLSDTTATIKAVGEDIKAIPSTSTKPLHPSVHQQAVDLAIASIKECQEPMRLSQIIEIAAKAELEKNVVPEMGDDVPTITEHLGLGATQALACRILDKQDARQAMIAACDNIITENKEAPEASILLGMSQDFRDFEAGLETALGQLVDVNVAMYERFVIPPANVFEKAPFFNMQVNGKPIMSKVLEDNCLHELLTFNTPMIKSDDGKFLFWLIEYDGNNFCVYDQPCKCKNCVLILTNKDIRYQRFISFVYAWYSHNYNYLLNVHKKFLKGGGVNFLFLDQFSLIERSILTTRNIVVSAINRYQEFGVWKGFVLPTAHWLGGWLSQIYGALQTMLGVCGMLSIGYFTFKMWNPSVPINKMAKGQLISSGDSGTHNRSNNTRLIVSKKLGARQQSSDHCLSSVIRKRINCNTMYIEFSDNSTNRQAIMKCLIVKGRHMLVIKHYYDYLSTYSSENSSCYLCWNDVGRIPFKFEQFEWNWFDNSNFGLIELPKTISERKSLIGFMATEHQANTNLSPDCEIIDINADTMKIYDERISYCGTVIIEPSSYSEELIMDGCWRYSRNYPGMCGSILLSKNLTNPILGMHVAGGKGFGYSEPLTRDMFSELEGKLDGPIIEYRELDIPHVPVEERKVYLRGTHRYAGNIDAEIADDEIKLAKVENGISKIVPSLLHGVYPILSEPGPLTPKDPRLNPKFSPLVEGCEKMCNPTYEFDPCDIADSEEHLLQKLLSSVKPLRLNVDPLTISQSLNGIEDLPGYEHINWDTSEGFPLSRIRPTGARNKRWLFNFNEEGKAIGIHDALLDIMDQKMDDRKKGIVPVTLHDDCLKDARIPLDKVNVPGKTRIFSISPVDFTIHFRQYYLDFIAAYGAARFKAEHAIGINVHGLEWTDLANLVGSDYMITGDYSGFGPTLNTEVLHAAFRIIFKWYQYHGCANEDHNIRYVMSREIANARHLMRDYVYQTSCGMPSGNPGTVIFNSLVNSIYIRCAYLKIMRNTLYGGLSCFSRYVTLVTYGDDLIAKLHPNIVNNFNFNSLSLFFFDKNLKFTDAAKTGVSVDPTLTLKQATFLKHCFNPHPTRNGVYLAGLDKASITECVNWVRSSPDMKDATYQNCNQATMLAYGWGVEYFNDLVNTIRVAWRNKFDEYFECRTWTELDSLFLDQGWDPNLKW